MDHPTLHAAVREAGATNAKHLRTEGMVPAILYGGAAKSGTPVSVAEGAFDRVFRAAGESTIVQLVLGPKDTRNVLIHEVTRDPRTDRVTHADFYEVRMDKTVRAMVPLVIVGESPAVKNEGGNLVRTLQEIEVECLPGDLPHELAIDATRLAALHASLRVKDIVLPKGVTVHADAEDTIALIEPPRSKEEVDALSTSVDEQAAVAKVKTVAEEKREKEAAQAAEEA